RGNRNQLLSLSRSDSDHHLGRRRSGQQPCVRAPWCSGAATAHPGLYRLFLLGIPRKSRRRGRLSLMSQPEPRQPPPGIARRLLWFVGLWIAGVAVVIAVAYAIRWAIMP